MKGLRDAKHYNRLDRRKVHKPETRTNCEARFSIYLDNSASSWRVRKIDNKHNHELTLRCMVHLIVKYRSLIDAAKAQIDGFNKNAKALKEYIKKTNDGGDHSFLLRYGALHTRCHWLFFLGAQCFHLFEKAMKGIWELCRDLEHESGHS
ncbi:hypothetical protein AHAS_Ahas17G0242900 [Arachis hypogaea]